jgi:hypothetical protein
MDSQDDTSRPHDDATAAADDARQLVPMIMPPPSPPAPPLTTASKRDDGQATGIENPSSVRNLKDILHYTTQMTDVGAQNRDAGKNNLTLAEEVSKRQLLSRYRRAVRTAHC